MCVYYNEHFVLFKVINDSDSTIFSLNKIIFLQKYSLLKMNEVNKNKMNNNKVWIPLIIIIIKITIKHDSNKIQTTSNLILLKRKVGIV